MPSNGREAPPLTRRKLLALAAGSTAGLAGCMTGEESDGDDGNDTGFGDDTDDEETEGEVGDGEPVRTAFRTLGDTDFNPQEWNANPHHPQTGRDMVLIQFLWNDPLLLMTFEGHDDHPIALENWEHDGCTTTYEIRDDLVWWDGTQVTATDLRTSLKIGSYLGVSSADGLTTEWTVEDDLTLRVDRLDSPEAEAIARPTNVFIDHKDDYWSEWIERYEDSTTSEEWTQTTADLQNMSMSLDDIVDNGLGNGLWKPANWTEIDMTLEKHEEHHRYDWTNLEEWEVRWEPDGQKRIEEARNDRVDIGRVFPNNKLEYVRDVMIDGGRSVTFRGTDNKHIDRREVRQAIAYVVDHLQIREIFKQTFDINVVPPSWQDGMTHATDTEWLGEEWMEENLIDYGQEAKLDEAEERMRSAGYSMEGGVWVDEAGDPAEGIRFVLPEHPHLTALGQYLESALSEFGIELDMMVTTWAEYFNIWENTKEYDVLDSWISGRHPSQVQFGAHNLLESISQADPQVVEWPAAETDECAYEQPEPPTLHIEENPVTGFPVRDTFPAEFGAEEIQGDGQTLYPAQWYREMTRSPDEERVKELARKVAWYYNWKMFHLEYYNEIFQYTLNTEDFVLDDHPETYARQNTLILRGHVNAKTE